MPNFSGKWTLQAQMQAIAAGTWSGISLPSLFAWGINGGGQLGQNNTTTLSSPVQVGALTDWSQVSTGGSCAAIKTNGTLWSWGANTDGQLGQNNIISLSSPVQVGALTDWAQVSLGLNHCLAIKTTGTLWSWGRNQYGQLGQNIAPSIRRSSPVQVGALTDWAQISGAPNFSLAVKTTGTLWSWGNSQFGQLGQNNSGGYAYLSSPVQVGALTNWLRVSGGSSVSFAIKTDGTLWSWGINNSGNLGLNDRVYRSSPVQVGALTDWARVSAGGSVCAAIKTNGTLWAWGRNTDGQLGQNNTINRSSPVQIGALTDWAQVSAGQASCVAIKTNGTLWSWGSNGSGRLGQNDTVYRSSPVQVGSLTTWSSIGQGASREFSVAILTLTT